MKKIANGAAILFIISVVILSIISILGIWDFFQGDVISKSFESIGLLAIVAIIVIAADHFMDRASPSAAISSAPGSTAVPAGAQDALTFSMIRKATLILLIVAAALLALFGIMSIWQVVASDILHKSLASISIICFSSFVIAMTCLERENNPILRKKNFSLGMILVFIILVWIFIAALQ